VSRASKCLLLAVLVACSATLLTGGVAQARSKLKAAYKPVVTSVTGPRWIYGSGGKVTIHVRFRGATKCVLYGVFSSHTGSCSKGDYTVTYRHGPNQFTHAQPLTGGIRLSSAARTVDRSFGLHQYGLPRKSAPTTAPASRSLLAGVLATLAPYLNFGQGCVSGADHCFYGPIGNGYSDYGNHAPYGLGDCTFAAAAYWNQIVLNITPDPAVIGYQFAAAGGTAQGGLNQNAVWSYWTKYGIGGSLQTGLHSYFTDQADVENGVRSYGAMIVTMREIAGDYLGQFQFANSGGHDVVVDGYTPEGPLVVTWGQTVQMTWQQWGALAANMYGIGARPL
jgi:hypothetical protein